LSLRLLIDEDTQAKLLVSILRSAGYDIVTVAEEGLSGASDGAVLAQAHVDSRAVLTRNADDYRELHDTGVKHSGILAIYQSANRLKNMSSADVANALKNLEQSGLDIRGHFVPLNHWDY
jgi:predicted nuclease of predicted toxin-antitoxin system